MFFNTKMQKNRFFLAKNLHIQKKSRIFAHLFNKRDKIQIAKSKRKEGDTAEKR